MIHLLAVDKSGPRTLREPPSIEIVWANGAEDAVEKLARNRRIDAVLFFDDVAAREMIELLSAEDASSPPLFQGSASSVEGVTALDPARLFDDLRRRLGE